MFRQETGGVNEKEKGLSPDRKDAFSGQILWLIKLRWLAALGLIATVYLSANVLKIAVKAPQLYLVSFTLIIYNFIFLAVTLKVRRRGSESRTSLVKIANLQIALDLLSLAVLLHFSGGVENPFIFYFIFHMIIAGTLLSRRAAFLQATFAVSLMLLAAVLEYKGILTHYYLKGFIGEAIYDNPLYLSGVLFVFTTTIYIAVYMAASVSGKLRDRERRLRQAAARLEEKDRIKSEYVLRVSHDIKEHLSAVQSCLEPVKEEIGGSLNKTQKDLLSTAASRTGKLLLFVNALLEITRIRLARKIEREEFSLREMIAAIRQDMRQRAQRQGVEFYVDLDTSLGRIKGIKVYIEEAILNLLTNALKYTPEGEVRLTVREKNKRVLITVQDTGIGIPEEDIPLIFNEFYRAGNARRAERFGSGLGLSITKAIVEMHRGRIWAESKEGGGSTFYIDLPK